MKKIAQQRIDAFRKIGCIACSILGLRNFGYDVHHLVDKGYRSHSGGDMATIPLCPWHHRGVGAGLDIGHLGPSLAVNKRAFVKHFGTERELLAKVNELLS